MATVEEIVQRLEGIEARLVTAEKTLASTEQERDAYRALYIETMERCRKLELGLVASRSERLPDNEAQLSLGVLSMVLSERQLADLDTAIEAWKAEQQVQEHTRRKPTGRKPLREHLPHVEIQLLPRIEVQKEGLDAFERIGEDVCETLERRPASLASCGRSSCARIARAAPRPKCSSPPCPSCPSRADSQDPACSVQTKMRTNVAITGAHPRLRAGVQGTGDRSRLAPECEC